MPKYLFQANYVGAGIPGLMKDGGTKRVAAAKEALASVGATLDSMYFAFGDTDLFGVIDCPDAATAVAASLLINSSGSVGLSLTPLLTAEEVDAATQKTGTYRAPGA
jgi:uncharacterized protein with GYD domain